MNNTIEQLRKAEYVEKKRLTPVQVRGVVNGLQATCPLEEIMASTELDKERVLDVVAEFGTWLTHVHGGSKADIIYAADHTQQMLFKEANRKKGPKKVIVPVGFERRSGHRRDVSKALAAIVVAKPNDDAITRFLARKYPSRSKILTFPLVSAVWRFATLGRLNDLATLSPDNGPLNQMIVVAYDTLNLARETALEGLNVLETSVSKGELLYPLEVLQEALTKCHWVNEAEMARLSRLMDAYDDSELSKKALTRQLSHLAKSIADNPSSYAYEEIASLSDGQVRRICQNAGLPVDGNDRAEESNIRKRLAKMGLKSDIDQLVPAGIRALQVGLVDEFWSAMELRVAGDPSWREEFEKAFSSAE